MLAEAHRSTEREVNTHSLINMGSHSMQHVSRVKFNLTEFITRIIKRDRGNSEIEMIVFILRYMLL